MFINLVRNMNIHIKVSAIFLCLYHLYVMQLWEYMLMMCNILKVVSPKENFKFISDHQRKMLN